MRERPVVIVGAGPTGMTAAALLERRGVPVLLVEREMKVRSIPRAVHIDDEVMRVWDEAGLAEVIAPICVPIRGMSLVDRRRRQLIAFDRTGVGEHGFPRSNGFDQPALESVMRQALAERPAVELRAGVEVVSVTPVHDGRPSLRVDLRDLATGAGDVVEAAFVLGCDGARSSVRHYVGGSLENLGLQARWLVVDVRDDELPPPHDGVLQVCDPASPSTYVHVGRGLHRWEFMLARDEDAGEANREDMVRARLTAWIGPRAYTCELRRSAVYTFHSLLARQYRRGRAFILGDAAHQMPPFVGQGLGAGVRDAANLCWKLDAVLRGNARDALLDTYAMERRPHVRSVIGGATLVGRMISGGFGGRARQVIIGLLGRLPAFRDFVLDQTFPRYRRGPLVGPPRSGPAGMLIPRMEVEVAGFAIHLDRALGSGFALVSRGSSGELWVRRINDDDNDDDLRLHDPTGTLTHWLDRLDAEIAIVRPDRVVLASGRRRDLPRWLAQLGRIWTHVRSPPSR